MGLQYICITCWKQFSAAGSLPGGAVICPHCGSAQPHGGDVSTLADSDEGSPEGPLATAEAALEQSGELEAMSWDGLSGTVDEPTDELPNDTLETEDVGMDDAEADEKTPVVSSPLIMDDGSGADFALVATGPVLSAEWLLRTPSGLIYRFTDPEALLGWKKKLSAYQTLEVSPDGHKWKDFALFVAAFEQTGQAMQAFLEAGMRNPKAPTESFPPTTKDPSARQSVKRGGASPGPQESKPDTGNRPVAHPTTQFTFKTTEEKGLGWGVYLLFAALGLAIGAGVVALVLYLTA